MKDDPGRILQCTQDRLLTESLVWMGFQHYWHSCSKAGYRSRL